MPNHIEAQNGNTAAMFDLKNTMGHSIGVWNVDEWQRIDNEGAAKMWLDRSISAWYKQDTQWHLNEFSAITMLNTHSMSRTSMNWCEQNNLMTIVSKYLEADGKTIKQYVTTDNGVEHDHNQAMALYHWHRDNTIILTNQLMAIRVNDAGNGTDLHWTSPVTIMHSSMIMTLENDGK
eukprot:5730621-Amphidinium_carterae.4